MTAQTTVDGSKRNQTTDVDCSTVARMPLSELLYHVLTGEGSPFRIGAAAKVA